MPDERGGCGQGLNWWARASSPFVWVTGGTREPASQGQCPVQIELGAGTKAEKIFPIRPARPRAARRAIKGLAGVCLRGDKLYSRRKRRAQFEGDQFSPFCSLGGGEFAELLGCGTNDFGQVGVIRWIGTASL